MITIEIQDSQIHEKRGVSAKNQKPYHIREQTAFLHGASRYPQEFPLTLPDDVQAYQPGYYEITTPFVVGRFGLNVSRDLGLRQVKGPAATKAA